MAYLGHEQEHIQRDRSLLHLAKRHLKQEEAAIKGHLTVA
jgi:hypothetical protein